MNEVPPGTLKAGDRVMVDRLWVGVVQGVYADGWVYLAIRTFAGYIQRVHYSRVTKK